VCLIKKRSPRKAQKTGYRGTDIDKKTLTTVSSLEVIATAVSVIVMLATVSVAKRTIVASVMLVTVFLPAIAPVALNTVLIRVVMRWRIAITLTIAMIIAIRSFAVIVSVHNGISAAVSNITGIIRIVLRIMGAGAEQQRKTDERHFFSDRVHFYSP